MTRKRKTEQRKNRKKRQMEDLKVSRKISKEEMEVKEGGDAVSSKNAVGFSKKNT